MRNLLFLSFLFIPFMGNAQTVRHIFVNPYTGLMDTVYAPVPKMKPQYPKMVVIGENDYHTVFIDEELLKQFEEMEAKKEDE